MTEKSKKYSHSQASSQGTSIAFQDKACVVYQDFKNSGKLNSFAENSFAITLFERGKGTHTINTVDYQVTARQVHLQFPEQKEKWKLQPGVSGQRLIVKKALAQTFSNTLQFTFSPYNQHLVLDLDSPAFKKIEAEFLAIKKELGSHRIFVELVNARCKLIALMITLWVEYKFGQPAVSATGSLAYRFHSLVEHHFKTQKSISFYARQLCITSNYLSVICRKQYKMSALDFIQERVLLEAKRLLHSSDQLIKVIAFELGFKSMSHFSYFFRAKTGLTPKEYKILMNNS